MQYSMVRNILSTMCGDIIGGLTPIHSFIFPKLFDFVDVIIDT